MKAILPLLPKLEYVNRIYAIVFITIAFWWVLTRTFPGKHLEAYLASRPDPIRHKKPIDTDKYCWINKHTILTYAFPPVVGLTLQHLAICTSEDPTTDIMPSSSSSSCNSVCHVVPVLIRWNETNQCGGKSVGAYRKIYSIDFSCLRLSTICVLLLQRNHRTQNTFSKSDKTWSKWSCLEYTFTEYSAYLERIVIKIKSEIIKFWTQQ